jgi:predicted Zn-dependent protease
MARFERLSQVAGLLLVAAGSAGAQATAATPPVCEATQASSGNSARANLSMQLAQKATTPEAAAGHLRAVVKAAENPDKNDNAAARAYVLGSALSLWMNQPGVGFSPKRGALGFSSNADATIDVATTMDSLFKIVEATKPGCSEYTAYWRGGQKFYLDLVNGAINAMNADKLDSAEYYATTAHKVFPTSPYGGMVLGGVANKKNNFADAVKYWQMAADAAEKDTSYRDVRRQVLSNIGSTQMNIARDPKTPKPAQVDAAKRAAEAYTQLVAIPGTTGPYLSGGRQNLQAALLIAGDTSSAVKSYEAMLANPSGYEYQDLLNSAVNASRANRSADAARLFEATLVQNPYNRDALFNLAVMHLTLNQHDKVGPIVTRLIAVDPGNPDNYLLGARAYVDLAKKAKGAAATALNDTTLSWYTRATKLPVDVQFTEFSPSDTKLELAGTVLDRRDKVDEAEAAASATTTRTRSQAAAAARAKPAAKTAASYTPKTVTLKFDAIDKSGAVLGSQSVTTTALQPGKTATFRVSIDAPKAVAYRYTISD